MEERILTEIIRKNHMAGNSIIEFPAGKINGTYLVDDEYVIKIEREHDLLKHQPELFTLCEAKGVKTPRLLDSGVIEGKPYLVMSRIIGRPLSEVWLSFSEKQRERVMEQLVAEMRLIHSISFEKYSVSRPLEVDTFKEFITSSKEGVTVNTSTLDKRTLENLDVLLAYYAAHVDTADDLFPPVFVHNDLHFENILCDGETIAGLIDFDFTRQAPRDYELWHMLDFFADPLNYVHAEFLTVWANYTPTADIQLLRRTYPELFSHPRLIERIRLDYVNDTLNSLHWNVDRFNRNVERYYRSTWIEDQLS